MGKRKEPPAPAKPDPRMISLQQRRDESRATTIARCVVAPETQAAMTMREFHGIGVADELTLDALIAELERHGNAGNSGDLGQGERMLVAQAHALNAIFGFCAHRARGRAGRC